jgi:hypothetical protein
VQAAVDTQRPHHAGAVERGVGQWRTGAPRLSDVGRCARVDAVHQTGGPVDQVELVGVEQDLGRAGRAGRAAPGGDEGGDVDQRDGAVARVVDDEQAVALADDELLTGRGDLEFGLWLAGGGIDLHGRAAVGVAQPRQTVRGEQVGRGETIADQRAHDQRRHRQRQPRLGRAARAVRPPPSQPRPPAGPRRINGVDGVGSRRPHGPPPPDARLNAAGATPSPVGGAVRIPSAGRPTTWTG